MQQIVFAQENAKPDSLSTLNEVVITAFEQNRVISCGTIVKVLNSNMAPEPEGCCYTQYGESL